ncbi:MAG: hypothetical protein DBY32_11405 [Phascolarctobacterium sp.]|nr:MAG: hypothetical protein DBY32_11405 [Phascolarctobacterium sp.]
MLTLEKLTQKQFYAGLEGKQVTLIDRVFCKQAADVDPKFLDGNGLNTGKFVKRSKDFYRDTPKGKSYGDLKGKQVFKVLNSKQEVVYIAFMPDICYGIALLYKVAK